MTVTPIRLPSGITASDAGRPSGAPVRRRWRGWVAVAVLLLLGAAVAVAANLAADAAVQLLQTGRGQPR